MSQQALLEAFTSFASFGASTIQTEIDNSKFSKLCKDCHLIDKRLTKTDVDLIFTRCKRKGERRLDFNAFMEALQQIADHKGTSRDIIVDQILAAHGPAVNATQADAVRFHDDKSLYTGVYARGGPTNIDNTITLSNLADRSDADVRGIKMGGGSSGFSAYAPEPDMSTLSISSTNLPQASMASSSSSSISRAAQGAQGAPPSSASGSRVAALPSVQPSSRPSSQQGGARLADVPRPPSSSSIPVTTQAAPSSARRMVSGASSHSMSSNMELGSLDAAVTETFKNFCTTNAMGEFEIDSFKFVKLLRDTNMLDRKLTQTSADLVFTKSKAKGAKKMTLQEFKMLAIPLIAQTKGVEDVTVLQQLAACSGPKLHATVADQVRFHDDQSTYTGVYARGGPTNIDNAITLSNLADRTDADIRGIKYGATSGKDLSKPHTSSNVTVINTTHAPSASASRSSKLAANNNNNASSSTGGGGNIFDRLNDKSTYTGVYAKRFEGGELGGRINDDTINVNNGRAYTGSTNGPKSDSNIRDISR